MLVRFVNVGRQNTTWEADLPDLNRATLLRAIKRKVRLASQYVDVSYDPSTRRGEVLVGSRTVGNFEILS